MVFERPTRCRNIVNHNILNLTFINVTTLYDGVTPESNVKGPTINGKIQMIGLIDHYFLLLLIRGDHPSEVKLV